MDASACTQRWLIVLLHAALKADMLHSCLGDAHLTRHADQAFVALHAPTHCCTRVVQGCKGACGGLQTCA